MSQSVDFVLLHGGVQGGWVWDATLAALAAQADSGVGRALALDIPGCGTKRGRATGRLGPDEVAAELLADIEAAGLRDILLVGHSQAGTVLPRLVERRPDLFRRVVHVSTLAPLPGQTVLNFRESGLPSVDSASLPERQPDDPGELYRTIFCNDMTPDEASSFLAKVGQDAWPEPMYAASDWRYEHLGATPASYVVCLRDAVFPVAWQEAFAERFKVSRLIRIDAAHQVMCTRPHALAEILRREAASS
jgi:pimeloyl-ACP methyl ester carboxylesterase